MYRAFVCFMAILVYPLKSLSLSCKLRKGKLEGIHRMNDVSLVQLIISVVLFFVMFFGIGFLLNMLLRMTWLMAIVYPVVVVFIVDEENVSFLDYIFKPGTAFPALMDKLQALQIVDILILSGGFAGAIVSGIVMIYLRKAGYRMF